ncbi:MAG TPA: hypothetical protein VMM79_09715 [Longimicrobiales bacterium]|nr:hypothetical protein [Longimicrobiales bacterium]
MCDEWALPAAGNPIGIVGDHVILGEVVPDMSTDRVSYDWRTFFTAERRGTALDTLFELDSAPRIARRIESMAGAVQEWLVVDATGEVLARASTPADLLVTEIGEDHVVGFWRDEMEVEFVHAYRLDRVN